MSDPRLLAELSRRNGAGSTWWRRRNPAQRLLILAGLVVLAAVVSPTVRGALVGLVLLVALVAALTIVLLGRIVRRHPLADLAAGDPIGRRHARRHAGQSGPVTRRRAPTTTHRPVTHRLAGRLRRRRLGHPGRCQPHMFPNPSDIEALPIQETPTALPGAENPPTPIHTVVAKRPPPATASDVCPRSDP